MIAHNHNSDDKRVVITGMGAVTPLGDASAMWQALINGQSGITNIEADWASHVDVRIAGQVTDFDPLLYLSRKDARRMNRASQFAVASAKMAMDDAGLSSTQLSEMGERIATVFGTTMGGHTLSIDMTQRYYTNNHARPNPIEFTHCLPNMPAHYVSRYFSALGPLKAPSAACATGTQSIGEAVDLIRMGRANIVITGSVETIIMDYILAGFHAMSALATDCEQTPDTASRPFDAQRNGFVLSEGAGTLILESFLSATARDANIYAEVVGHATSADAYHIAAIPPNGSGMIRCMQWALQDANLPPHAIGYLNAHGSSTPANDEVETLATKYVFGDNAYNIPISSNKSMLGHLMAAAGMVEAIASIKSLNTGIIPPTINLDHPDPQCDLDYVPHEARQVRGLRYVMSNNYGLGGQNASVIFGKV